MKRTFNLPIRLKRGIALSFLKHRGLGVFTTNDNRSIDVVIPHLAEHPWRDCPCIRAELSKRLKLALDTVLARMLKDQSVGDAGSIAALYALRGQSDQAFDWLDRAYQQKDPGLIYIKGHWLLRSIEGDPRYRAFLKKVNLPE